MANPWFRMYAEFANDPKVQRLSEADQRRFVMLLCIRCSNGDVTLHETLHDENVTFQLRISDEEWQATKATLLSKNLIDKDNNPTSWDKRQFTSDVSAARVAKHRALHKKECNGDVTLQKQKSNVLDTDTDTDTEKKQQPTSGIPSTPKKSTKKKTSAGITLNEFLQDCELKGQDAITESDPVFEYAKSIGLPIGFLYLGWSAFKSKQAADKRQADWRATFRNYVKAPDWLGVWKLNREGEYYLTDAGKQLERELSGVAA